MRRNIEIIKDIFDIIVIFSPFILLSDGYEKFLILFYLIYLPYLGLCVYEQSVKKSLKKKLRHKKVVY